MKIVDNPTAQLLKKRIAMLEERAVTPDQKAQVDKLKKDFSELSTISDRFNSTFSSKGWIAYDTMDMKVMEKALSIAKEKGVAQANDYLIDSYDQRTVEAGITKLWGTEPFRKRLYLIKLAYDDFLCGRYHACIPLLLMMIDGVVADGGTNLGFFSERSDVTAWDSIAGHETGLLAIKNIFYASRGRTDKGKITLPCRNGIMHGRDLGYANREVAAKCWALLFAIRDVLAAKCDEAENRRKHEVDKLKSIEDIQQDIQTLHDGLREVDEMDSFKRTPVVIGIDILTTGLSTDYAENTPERALVEFIELWQERKYGNMADYIFLTGNLTKSKMAGRLRETFTDKQPQGFSFAEILDLSSCTCDITLTLSISHKGGYASEYNIQFRLLYCEKGSTVLVVNPAKEGKWKIAENFMPIREIGTTLGYIND